MLYRVISVFKIAGWYRQKSSLSKGYVYSYTRKETGEWISCVKINKFEINHMIWEAEATTDH